MSNTAVQPTPQRWRFGPGLLVTAAFIGPGTVATASQAGAKFGFALLWTLLFAVVATIVLQEMAARLGVVARRGLAAAIRETIRPAWLRNTSLGLVMLAIVLGNTAYQTGNLTGAGMGLEVLTGIPSSYGAMIFGIVIMALLALDGSSEKVQTALIVIVLAMSFAFFLTAAVTQPDLVLVTRGLVTISVPEDSLLTVLALIGTTVVPYNLFLHATTVQQRWSAKEDMGFVLRAARLDTIVSVLLGGVVTMAIVATAAAAFYGTGTTPANAGQLAQQLEPLFGTVGKIMFAAGLAAAGITSAITAPLAAGYVVAGTFPAASQRQVNLTAMAVVLVGTVLATRFGRSPQQTIVVAQAANGLLLPLVTVFLLVVMNRRQLLGDYCNGWKRNLAGGFVVLVACGLGAKSLMSLL